MISSWASKVIAKRSLPCTRCYRITIESFSSCVSLADLQYVDALGEVLNLHKPAPGFPAGSPSPTLSAAVMTEGAGRVRSLSADCEPGATGEPPATCTVVGGSPVLVGGQPSYCLLYTSDAADDLLCVD